ncbi:MAG: hypothetical protein QXL67_04565, partial [Candidatus Bathyarchaeia archaeon]
MGNFKGALSKNLWSLLDKLSSNPDVRWVYYTFSVVFFVLVILLPLITGILLKADLLGEVFVEPKLIVRAQSAIAWSFIIAFIVSILDLLAG